MIDHLVDVVIPLMRPERLAAVVHSLGGDPRVKVCVVASVECPTVPDVDFEVALDGGGTWAQRINLAYYRLGAPYLFTGADDIRFHEGWLDAALAVMRRVEGVVVVDDLHNPFGTMALVSREYVEEYGTIDGDGVVHEGYRHNYVDNELFETARYWGKLAYAPESVVEHLHPNAGKGDDDEVYRLGISSLAEDRALYDRRRLLWIR